MSQIVSKNKTYVLKQLRNIHFYFKTQEMCNEALSIEPILLVYVAGHLRKKEMCNEAMRNWSWLSFFSDQYKTQGMCNEVVHAMLKAFR